jgi:hypothetical protein
MTVISSATTSHDVVYCAGCEYGDQVAWCRTYSELNCNDPAQARQCCNTCQAVKTTTLRYTTTTMTSTTTASTRLTSTTPATTTTTTTATTTTAVLPPLTTTVAAASGSCPLGDGASFCSTITGDECYYYAQLCCDSCPKYYTGISGKLQLYQQDIFV